MITAIVVLILRILMLAFILGFVGWLFITLWRDLKMQTALVTEKKIPYISIYNEEDPAESKRIFTHPDLTIGRDQSNDIQVADETVSSYHARISFHNRHWWVEDSNSTNGSFINDEKVETPTILVNGDDLRVGKVNLRIEIQPN